MNWDDLRYVLALIREGSLNRAAASLKVSHTTVGRRLKTLEEELGVRLFDRTPDGFIPTPEGQDLGETAAKVEEEIFGAEGRVLGRDERLSGALRVATIDVLFTHFIDVFHSFGERYPNVDLTVLNSYESVSLSRREADVAIRMSAAPPDYLVGRRLATVSFAVYASHALAERIGPDAAYDDYPWIGWDERNPDPGVVAWVNTHAPRARFTCRLDGSAYAMLRAVETGLGVYILPCFAGDANPNVTRVSHVEETNHHIWILTLSDLRRNRRIRAFMDHVSTELKAQWKGEDA